MPDLANVRRLTSVPLPLLYVTFRHRLHDIPEFYVALLNSKYSLTFVEVKHLSERAHTTVLAVAASDFNALPVDLENPVGRDGQLDATNWMANPALSEAAYLMLDDLRRYVPFRLGHWFRDPDSDVDWDNTFFQPNLDQQLFINEVASEKYCTEVNYPAIENLFFAGDTCINPIAVATVESGVYSGLQAASAIARRHRLRPVHMSVPQSLSRAPAVAVEDHASALCCRRQNVGRPRECGRAGLEPSTRRRTPSPSGESGRRGGGNVCRMVDNDGLALPAHLVRLAEGWG